MTPPTIGPNVTVCTSLKFRPTKRPFEILPVTVDVMTLPVVVLLDAVRFDVAFVFHVMVDVSFRFVDNLPRSLVATAAVLSGRELVAAMRVPVWQASGAAGYR